MSLSVEEIKPYGGWVLVERFENKEEMSAGGVVLPSVRLEKKFYCKVLAVGSGVVHNNGERLPYTTAKPGDVVVARQFEGIPVSKTNQNLLIVDGRRIEAIASSKPWPASEV